MQFTWVRLEQFHIRPYTHLDILVHNIEIKRYKDIFHPIFFPVSIENIFLGTILNILKCHYNILKKKISLYVSKYCVQKCLVCNGPNAGIALNCDYFSSRECLGNFECIFGLLKRPHSLVIIGFITNGLAWQTSDYKLKLQP